MFKQVTYLRLGGVDQWVMIRGESMDNPPLILLYGGPGFTETHFFLQHNAALEKAFTVVYWDQRGTGKSSGRDVAKSSLTVEQLISDLDELVDVVRTRTGHPKVVVLGHSWGSILGVLYAARHPEKVAVYVGCAQIGDWPATEAASYAWVLGEAERRNDRKTVEKLRAIGPPPYPAQAVWTERTCSQKLDGQLTLKMLWEFARPFFAQPELSVLDLPKTMLSFRSSFNAMWDEVSRINLIKLVPALQVPVFFLVGRRDRWVLPETTLAYFNALTAPSKQLIWFDESGHEAFVDEPEKFNRTMLEVVRPVVDAKPVNVLRYAGASAAANP